MIKIMITGHRPDRLKGKERLVTEWVNEQLDKYKPLCISGMAQGVDQIFATAAREKGLKYWCVFPFKRPLHQIESSLVENAERTIYYSQNYEGPHIYTERDWWMVDVADVVLAVWDGEKVGGTWETIRYAQKQNKTIIYFNWEGEKYFG